MIYDKLVIKLYYFYFYFLHFGVYYYYYCFFIYLQKILSENSYILATDLLKTYYKTTKFHS